MLPAPDEAWLTDAQGHHYTAELRVVAKDLVARYPEKAEPTGQPQMAEQNREG